jgi:hypothetical protein
MTCTITSIVKPTTIFFQGRTPTTHREGWSAEEQRQGRSLEMLLEGRQARTREVKEKLRPHRMVRRSMITEGQL